MEAMLSSGSSDFGVWVGVQEQGEEKKRASMKEEPGGTGRERGWWESDIRAGWVRVREGVSEEEEVEEEAVVVGG